MNFRIRTFDSLFSMDMYYPVFNLFFFSGTQSSPIMPGGATPGTPNSKQRDKIPIRPKVVVALYNYKAIESGDLSLEKNQEYEVIDDSQEHWWRVKDAKGYVQDISYPGKGLKDFLFFKLEKETVLLSPEIGKQPAINLYLPKNTYFQLDYFSGLKQQETIGYISTALCYCKSQIFLVIDLKFVSLIVMQTE